MSQDPAGSAPAVAEPFVLTPIAPSPKGAVPAVVPCRTARKRGGGRKHGVTIEADWSVSTPHEIELERIAAAMGGYQSCVDLVDREVPALRELTQLRARRVLPQFTRNAEGRWTLRAPPPGCHCGRVEFHTAGEAAMHARDTQHVAAIFGARPLEVERLFASISQAHGTSFYLPPYDDDGAATRSVRERDGVAQLWDAGVHPQIVAALHEVLWPGGPAMPVWFYLGAVSRRPDLGWVADTLAAFPDEDVAVWLCWTDTELDRRHPQARAAWMSAGVPRNAIVALSDGPYTPVDVARLAALSWRNVPGAAITLAAWHRAGCHPCPEDITVIDGLDTDPWFEPSPGAVEWLWKRVGNPETGPSRTEIGLLLAVCGTRTTALTLLTKGIRDPRVAARVMNGESAALLTTGSSPAKTAVSCQ